jgi:hypothetical protein
MASLFVEKVATGTPVSLQDAKTFLRVDWTDDDVLISTLINAAADAVENFTNRTLCFKGYRQSLDAFPYAVDSMVSQQAYPPSYYAAPRYSTTLWNYSQMIKLYAPPVVSVERISYLASSDSQWHDLVAIPKLWYPGTNYLVNDKVMDNNSNVQQCSVAGKSDANPPTWSKIVTGTTIETTPDAGGEGSAPPVQWVNQGPFTGNPTQQGTISGQFGAFMVDTDSEPARIFPGPPGAFWPQVLYVPGAVQIHYTAGYSVDGTNVPGVFKTAILQCIAHWYENREAAMLGSFKELPNHVQMLLWTKRVYDMTPTRG